MYWKNNENFRAQNENTYYKTIMLSISNQKAKIFWMNEIQNSCFEVFLHRFFDVFRYLDDYNTYLLQFIFHFITHVDISELNLRSFFFKLRNHNLLMRKIANNESLLIKFIEIIRYNSDNIMDKYGILSVFILMSRVHSYGFKSNRIYEFVLNLVSQMMEVSKNYFESFILSSRNFILKLFLTYKRKDSKTNLYMIEKLESNIDTLS